MFNYLRRVKAFFLDEESRSKVSTFALCFGAILFDGVDTSSISVAGPAIAKSLGLPPESLTSAFVMTSVGAVIGYLLSGHFVNLWGARRVLIGSVISFGLGSLATTLALSLPQLSALRFVTAVGLGICVPAAISMAIDQSTSRLREAATTIVMSGLGFGTMFGGLAGAATIVKYGWQSIFLVGGVLPLAFALVLALYLPQPRSTGLLSASEESARNDRPSYLVSIKLLFDGPLKVPTICLWSFSFLVFVTLYGLVFWLPSLLIAFGFSLENAPLGVSAFVMGGMPATILLIPLLSRFPARKVLTIAACLAAVCIVSLGFHAALSFGLWFAIAGVGGGLIACSVGQSALAASLYPEESRTTGIGFSAAMGRFGSILGPALVGLLFSLHLAPEVIMISTIVPILLATLALIFFWTEHRPSLILATQSDT